MTDPETPAADSSTRIVDGEKQHRIRTTNGMAVLFRALIGQGGWYTGAKEFSRARKLAKAVGKLETPKDPEDAKRWSAEAYEFWLSERLRDHGKKCIGFLLERGLLSTAPDDDAIEPFLIDLGMSLKDD